MFQTADYHKNPYLYTSVSLLSFRGNVSNIPYHLKFYTQMGISSEIFIFLLKAFDCSSYLIKFQ